MFNAYRYKGRHRKPTNTSRNVLTGSTVALIGAGSFVGLTGNASAASDSTWDRLAQCESSGNWQINTGNGYSGGLQFAPRTWTGFGGGEFAPKAYQATREQQIVVAERVLAVQGWNAWPACSRKLGIRGESANPRQSPAGNDRREDVRSDGGGDSVRNSDPGAKSHTVVRGDTLSEIAQKYNVRGGWRYLAERNDIANPNRIYVGDVIRLS